MDELYLVEDGMPEATDNSVRDEDGPQEIDGKPISQDPTVVYTGDTLSATPNASEAAIVAELRKLLGITESPAGSNRTLIGEWYGDNGVAWCAQTQTYVDYHVVGGPALQGNQKFEYTPTFAQYYYNKKLWGMKPEPGALVFYAWYGPSYGGRWKGICHIERVEAVYGDRFLTIGGNVGNPGAVRRQMRSMAHVAGFAYPAYGIVKPAPIPTPKRKPQAGMTMLTLSNVGLRHHWQLPKHSFSAPKGVGVLVVKVGILFSIVSYQGHVGYVSNSKLG